MKRAGEFLIDIILLAGVVLLAWRFPAVLLVLAVFLAVTLALMLVERAVR
ncbi:MAG: hypothetical protein HY653_09015 [Acidobacteria bacterium]|nr:hypothetical protein [Acidobacteriota bacterium]